MTGSFCAKFESLRGVTHRSADAGAAATRIAQVCAEAGANCVAFGRLDAPLAERLDGLLRAAGIRVLRPPYAHGDLPLALDEAQVGVSMADFAIAETGTLVEIATNDADRLVSSLPRIHIGIVHEGTMLNRLYDSADRIRDAFRENGDHCVVSFISGPSRTGDIELKLTLGVHGPEIAHAVILEGSPHE